ncbi:MAG: hypothetical protein JEZ00_11310 [Anaerolineaceae bacterium]|nr:hypothetical protein [Anaerolineaceae bacterium]
MEKRAKTILLFFTLSIPVIWLIVGIVLFLMGNVNVNNWQTIFVLRDYPIWSLILLLALGLLYWISANNHWTKIRKWASGFKSLNRTTQTTIFLSLTFYISLLITVLLFPRLTGYTFQSDWALLLVATIPIIALVILLLIERATSVKAKFAGVEIEFQRTITEPVNQTVTLEQAGIAKGFTSEISRIVQEIQDKGNAPHVLIVRIGRQNQMRIDFLALRDYVYELTRVAPVEYIVFVDEFDEYLGFMPVEQFKAKYPQFGIEIMLHDFRDDNRQIRDERLFHVLEKIFHAPFFKFRDSFEFRDSWERIQNELVLPQWDAQRDNRNITERDLTRLGALRLYLQNPTSYQAYRQMVEYKVSGIPVVDDRRRFLGVATKEKVMQEVLIQLLEKGQKTG